MGTWDPTCPLLFRHLLTTVLNLWPYYYISWVRPSHFAIAALITFQLRYRLGIVATASLSSLAFGMRFRGGEFVTRKREAVLPSTLVGADVLFSLR